VASANLPMSGIACVTTVLAVAFFGELAGYGIAEP
jgi:hypothetical protein